ncbi:hypothetical protein H4R33_004081 [Dimargaris cristalligena]|uniref:Uncharacterized protein n=1 Tax=Dimargaris cristalligena TaxID=215637 RepID=A0A4P9ZQ54_9FUNG|nr:hypothetical protein H4R33_004081 [Dimargaris cristalligena]RKP34500.1 hypothetical protein BJ085DRAFT_40889 [Dimargaris cristalligena]|eukprot:RKP34500.1 hypothetical protein BJ085DRAFT_40889 [Dimargaris cristalligena]
MPLSLSSPSDLPGCRLTVPAEFVPSAGRYYKQSNIAYGLLKASAFNQVDHSVVPDDPALTLCLYRVDPDTWATKLGPDTPACSFDPNAGDGMFPEVLLCCSSADTTCAHPIPVAPGYGSHHGFRGDTCPDLADLLVWCGAHLLVHVQLWDDSIAVGIIFNQAMYQTSAIQELASQWAMIYKSLAPGPPEPSHPNSNSDGPPPMLV